MTKKWKKNWGWFVHHTNLMKARSPVLSGFIDVTGRQAGLTLAFRINGVFSLKCE